MVYLLGVAAAVFLGVGWVLQQRVATQDGDDQHLMSRPLLLRLVTSWEWWLGIAAMTVGQTFSAWALQLGTVSSVEPVLVFSLLVAFALSARLSRKRVRWQEIFGPIIVCAALAVFLAVGSPQANREADPASWPIILATIAAAAMTAVLALGALVGRRRWGLAAESGLLAAAAGTMYGLQDVATRGAIVAVSGHRLLSLVFTMWPWLLLGAATVGVLLSQAAFRAARLDYALPPTVAAQPIAGVVLGVTLLGDRLSAGPGDLAVEALCLAGMLVGVTLIGRAPAFGTVKPEPSARPYPQLFRRRGAAPPGRRSEPAATSVHSQTARSVHRLHRRLKPRVTRPAG